MRLRLSLVVGLVTFVGACATAGGSGTTAGTGDDTTGDDGGAAVDSGKKKDSGGGSSGDDSGVTPRDDGGTQPGDSGGGDSGGGGTCVKSPTGDGGAGACGVAPQCGCGATQTCDVTGADGATACTNAGSGAMGAGCTTTSGCSLGLTCVSGACHAFCNNPGQSCSLAGTGACMQVTNPQQQPIPNLSVCLINCKLDDTSSCPAGSSRAGCLALTGGNVTCSAMGTSTTTCTKPTDCAPGYTCAGAQGSAGSCTKWCHSIGSATGCPAGTQCRSFSPAAMFGGVEYGGCY